MKRIQKTNPPDSFTRYCQRTGASYDDLSNNHHAVKNELRHVLLADQGHICCYCGQKIEPESSVIEHVQCQNHNPDLQLDFTNLLCSCKGGQNRRASNPEYPLHCDASKGNNPLQVTPLEENCEEKFLYDEDGEIFGMDLAAKDSIKTLNLDNYKLKNRRKAAIEAYKWERSIDDDVDWNSEIEGLRRKDSNGELQEFCIVLVKYIQEYKLTAS